MGEKNEDSIPLGPTHASLLGSARGGTILPRVIRESCSMAAIGPALG